MGVGQGVPMQVVRRPIATLTQNPKSASFTWPNRLTSTLSDFTSEGRRPSALRGGPRYPVIRLGRGCREVPNFIEKRDDEVKKMHALRDLVGGEVMRGGASLRRRKGSEVRGRGVTNSGEGQLENRTIWTGEILDCHEGGVGPGGCGRGRGGSRGPGGRRGRGMQTGPFLNTKGEGGHSPAAGWEPISGLPSPPKTGPLSTPSLTMS